MRSKPLVACVLAICVTFGLVGCGDRPTETPTERVEAFFEALKKADGVACESFVEDLRAKCRADWTKMKMHTKDYQIHDAVTSGDRAIVSVTGTSCSVVGCETVVDPKAGMPSGSMTFDQAWNSSADAERAAKSGPSAAVRLSKSGKHWYIAG